jgi:hypothetical protein
MFMDNNKSKKSYAQSDVFSQWQGHVSMKPTDDWLLAICDASTCTTGAY